MIQDEVKYTINKYEKYEYEKEEFITEEFADKVKTEVLKIVKNIRIIKFGLFIRFFTFWRRLSESNRSSEFCRLAPYRLAKSPY